MPYVSYEGSFYIYRERDLANSDCGIMVPNNYIGSMVAFTAPAKLSGTVQ